MYIKNISISSEDKGSFYNDQKKGLDDEIFVYVFSGILFAIFILVFMVNFYKNFKPNTFVKQDAKINNLNAIEYKMSIKSPDSEPENIFTKQ